jgi:hypothetical protein
MADSIVQTSILVKNAGEKMGENAIYRKDKH